MRCKVAKNERNPDQGDDEDALHYIQQRKKQIEKKGKETRKKKKCPMSTKNRKMTQNDTCALDTRKRDEVKAVSFLPDFAQSKLFQVATRKKKGEKKGCPISKKREKITQNNTCALDTRKRDELVKAAASVSFWSDLVQSKLFNL